MGFRLIYADITTLKTDAIVNPTDCAYSGGGGVDKAIHDICGPKLTEALKSLPPLHLGEVRATDSFGLPCKFILHTSGPHWTGKSSLESVVLGSCYRNSVSLAHSLGCKSIAFPLISSQGKHFPKELALTVAVNAISEARNEYPEMDVVLAVYGPWGKTLKPSVFETVSKSIARTYRPTRKEERFSSATEVRERDTYYSNSENIIRLLVEKPTQTNLDKVILDENFACMLARLLEEKKLPHSAVQDEIGMSSVGFWKLLKGKSNPSKMTVFAIAIALKLSIEETKEMLMKAGYAINPSSLQDVITAAFIEDGFYDRETIDETLYSLDLQLLPGSFI